MQDTCSLQRSTLPVLWKTVALLLGSGQTLEGSRQTLRNSEQTLRGSGQTLRGSHRGTEAWHQTLSIGLWHPSLPTRTAITGYDTDLRKLSANWQFSVGPQTAVSF